jgi:hypothetical protein
MMRNEKLIDFLFVFEKTIIYMLGCISGLVVFVLATKVIDNRELFLKLKNIVKNKKHPEVVNITKNCELCSHKQSYAVAVLIIGYAYMYVCKEHAKLAKKWGYEVYYNNWRPKTSDE